MKPIYFTIHPDLKVTFFDGIASVLTADGGNGRIDVCVTPLSTWRPIDTAPRDGTEFLGYGQPPDDQSVYVVHTRWRDHLPDSVLGGLYALGEGPRGHFSVTVGGCAYKWKPTHWMPLPQPPNQ